MSKIHQPKRSMTIQKHRGPDQKKQKTRKLFPQRREGEAEDRLGQRAAALVFF